jgi:hypothetical protein
MTGSEELYHKLEYMPVTGVSTAGWPVRPSYLECKAVSRIEVTKCDTQYMMCPRAT